MKAVTDPLWGSRDGYDSLDRPVLSAKHVSFQTNSGRVRFAVPFCGCLRRSKACHSDTFEGDFGQRGTDDDQLGGSFAISVAE